MQGRFLRLVTFAVSPVLIVGCVDPPPSAEDLGLIAYLRDDGWMGLQPGVAANFWIGEDLFDPESAYPWKIEWDFGDGNSSTGNPVRHAYGAEGRYMVTAAYDGQTETRSVFVDLEIEEEVAAPLRTPWSSSEAHGSLTYPIKIGNRGTAATVAWMEPPADALHKVYVRIQHPDGRSEGPHEVGRDEWSWSLALADGADEAPAGSYEIQYWTEGPVREQPVRVRASVFY